MTDVPQFDPALKALLLDETGSVLGEGAPDREIAVIARLRAARRAVPGLRVVARFGLVITGRVPMNQVVAVRAHPNVASLKCSRRYSPTLVRSVAAAGAAPAQLRWATGMAGLDGRGTVLAIIDWGVDPGHANLRDSRGRTRLWRLWDQRGGAHRSSPAPFGYGRVFTRQQIDDALATGDVYGALDYDPQDADPDGNGTHGTHVADIAAGSGRAPGAVPGVARGADLIFVHLKADDTRPEDTLGDSVRVLEAIRYVADVADALGKPVVINCSFGRTGGPHDQSPLVTQGVDALLAEKPGRQVVFSAGNYFNAHLHTAGRIRTGETRELAWLLPERARGVAEIELWYSGDDRFRAELLNPAGVRVAVAAPGKDIVARDGDGVLAAVFHRLRDPNSGDNVVNALVQPRAGAGRWTLRVHGESVRHGMWHAWIERTTAKVQSRFPADIAIGTTTIGTIAAGERSVAVAAFDVEHDRPASFSSAGPTRDHRVKPDVAAPGQAIRAAKSSVRAATGRTADQFTVKSGTSMATPHVAGTIALMFQAAAPYRLSAEETVRILRRTARGDPAASQEELVRYGAGRIDAAAACRVARAVAAAAGASLNGGSDMSADSPSSIPQAIEDYLYQGSGSTCSGGPQPGARALASELKSRFGGGRAGIYNCRTKVGASGLSLHGEGRAVDFYRNAFDPAQAANARQILDWLLSPDAQGNEHALARRIGVQEIIWNRRIWSARRHAEGWRSYGGGGRDPHTDHIHIGLNWPGARMETSYWRASHPPAGDIAEAEDPAQESKNNAGWDGADPRGQGWNTTTHTVGTIRRVPVDDLKSGNQEKFSGDEQSKTTESAAGRAIVLIPSGVDPARKVDVLLHFHGWTHREWDPYAGWRQHSHSGTVRDVDQDRIESQLQAANPTQLIAVLPQGAGDSRFGPADPFPVEDYLGEVCTRLSQIGEPPRTAPGLMMSRGRLILSGHSGGGDDVARLLRTALGRSVAEVILFEAIHNGVAGNWAIGVLERVRKVLSSNTASGAAKAAALASCPKLMAYYSPPTAKVRVYGRNYQLLKKQLDKWFGAHAAALGAHYAEVRARFRVECIDGATHETIVRGLGDDPAAGPLADALIAFQKPTEASRLAIRGSHTWVPPTRLPKVRPPTVRPAKAATGADATLHAALEQALTKGTQTARAQLKEVLAFNGLSLEQWYGGISFTATFLDLPIMPSGGVVSGVHKELEERLKLAEAGLIRTFPGLSKAQIARKMGIYRIVGVRIPKAATGRSSISYHSLGLAIDINHPTNPFVGNQHPTLQKNPTDADKAKFQLYLDSRSPRIIERAMLLLRHQAFDIEQPITVPKGPGSAAGRLWEIHQRASQTLAEYLRLADDLDGAPLRGLVNGLPANAEHRDLDYWQKRIADDRILIKHWDFMHHPSPERGGYLDLGKELVEALVSAGLLWGGAYRGAKDIMHFDWRHGSLKRPN